MKIAQEYELAFTTDFDKDIAKLLKKDKKHLAYLLQIQNIIL